MVQILFVHAGTPDNPSSYVEPLTVDGSGAIVNCPADFFSETADEAFAPGDEAEAGAEGRPRLGLLDLGLFVLDPAAWSEDRARCEAPIRAIAVHERFLRRYPVRVLWYEGFFGGFPWNEPRCPPELCGAVRPGDPAPTSTSTATGAWSKLRRARGYSTDDIPGLFEPGCPGELRDAWLSAPRLRRNEARPARRGPRCPDLGTERTGEGDASSRSSPRGVPRRTAPPRGGRLAGFLERHHKPDLGGRRVAVLGGKRARLREGAAEARRPTG